VLWNIEKYYLGVKSQIKKGRHFNAALRLTLEIIGYPAVSAMYTR